MITSFGNKSTRDLFLGAPSKEVRKLPSDILKRALKLLDVIYYANHLQDISIYPGTRLERKQGDLQNFYSVRINDQWRIIFKWDGNNASNVQIMDYH